MVLLFHDARILKVRSTEQSFLRSASVGAKHVPLAHSTPVFAYRGIIIPLLCSYQGGSQGLSSTYEQAHVDLDLLTLASYYSRYRNGSSAAPSFSMAKYRFVPSLQ